MESRAGRPEWWGAFVVTYGLYLQATEFFTRSLLRAGETLSSASVQPTVLLGVVLAVCLGVALAVQHHVSVKRARDRDVRPVAFWVYAAACVATFAISITVVASGVTLPFNPSWIWVPQFVAFGWLAIELGVRPGDPKENRWGPAPKSPFDRFGRRIDNYKPPRP